MITETTPLLGLPLPVPGNELDEDVLHLRAALAMLDEIVASKAGDAEIQAALAAIVDTAPEAMDSLRELAQSLGNNPDFAGYVAAQIATINLALASLNTAVGTKADAAATTAALATKATTTALAAEATARQEGDAALALQLVDIPAQARLRAHFMSSN